VVLALRNKARNLLISSRTDTDMIDEIVKVLGTPAVIPAVFLALAGYVIATLLGIHRTRGQHRAEFLGLWKDLDRMDDMGLEVAVRHLFGTYLPASVVRKVCQLDYCSEGVRELAQLWPLFQYDSVSRQVTWAKPAYAAEATRIWQRRWSTFGYFAFALAAYGFLAVAFSFGPKSLLAWVCGFNAFLFPMIAFAALGRAEVFSLAVKVGPQWVDRLNDKKEPTSPEDVTG